MRNYKRVKGFFIAVAGLFTMVTLVSLLMPSRVVTTKAVPVQARREVIEAALYDFAQWKKWHPILMRDSGQIIISNPSFGVGATASWYSGDNETTLTITNILAEAVKISLTYPGENDVENVLSIVPMQDNNQLQVEWTAITTLKWYPWEKFSGIFVSQITGPGYQLALDNLKAYLENSSAKKEN